jgi:hypothetical protein
MNISWNVWGNTSELATSPEEWNVVSWIVKIGVSAPRDGRVMGMVSLGRSMEGDLSRIFEDVEVWCRKCVKRKF